MNISLPESKKMFTSERLANLSLICIEFKFLPSAASRLSNGIVYPFGFYKIVLKINIQKKSNILPSNLKLRLVLPILLDHCSFLVLDYVVQSQGQLYWSS